MNKPFIISKAEAIEGQRFWHETVDITETLGWVVLGLAGAATFYSVQQSLSHEPAGQTGLARVEHYVGYIAQPAGGDAAGLVLLGFSSLGRRYEARYSEALRDLHGTFRPIDRE